MRNFLFGLVLGTLATYYYLTQAGELRATIRDFWVRASNPPAHHAR